MVGINLEDSVVEQGRRSLVDSTVFLHRLGEIRKGLQLAGIDIFINLRIDTYLLELPNALEESLKRIDLYSIFIDGVFLPCITQKEDIESIVSHTDLPLNVMSIPGLPGFDELRDLGVKRISSGNFLYEFINEQLKVKTESLMSERSFDSLF